MTNQQFCWAMCYRYGLVQAAIPAGALCNCKRHSTLDPVRHHAATGCKNGGGRQNTHDMIKLTIAEMLRYATLRYHVEPNGVFRDADPDTGKRPDLIVEKGPLNALDIILDVAVTCPIPGAELRGDGDTNQTSTEE